MATLLCSCATMGSSGSRYPLRTVKKELVRTMSRMEEAETALGRLVEPGLSAPQRELDEYSRTIKGLEEAGAGLHATVEEMRVRGDAYVDALDRENAARKPEVRELGEQFRDSLSSLAEQAAEHGDRITARLRDYLGNLRQIRDRVAADPSPAQRAIIAPFARETIEEGKSIRLSIQPVVHALEGASVGTLPIKP